MSTSGHMVSAGAAIGSTPSHGQGVHPCQRSRAGRDSAGQRVGGQVPAGGWDGRTGRAAGQTDTRADRPPKEGKRKHVCATQREHDATRNLPVIYYLQKRPNTPERAHTNTRTHTVQKQWAVAKQAARTHHTRARTHTQRVSNTTNTHARFRSSGQWRHKQNAHAHERTNMHAHNARGTR